MENFWTHFDRRKMFIVVPILPIYLSICDQSYKASTRIDYDSIVELTSKLLIFTTLETWITIVGDL